MKFINFLLLILILGCDQPVEKTRGVPPVEKVKTEAPVNMDSLENHLQKRGYQTFRHEAEDSTYLMQQYYVVFLKAGENRNQDSTEVAGLQKQHLAHLSRMVEEGYASLTGPFGDDGEMRGLIIFNTPTQNEADSLAKLDPMVQAGRLAIEVHPWWAAKGGKLE